MQVRGYFWPLTGCVTGHPGCRRGSGRSAQRVPLTWADAQPLLIQTTARPRDPCRTHPGSRWRYIVFARTRSFQPPIVVTRGGGRRAGPGGSRPLSWGRRCSGGEEALAELDSDDPGLELVEAGEEERDRVGWGFGSTSWWSHAARPVRTASLTWPARWCSATVRGTRPRSGALPGHVELVDGELDGGRAEAVLAPAAAQGGGGGRTTGLPTSRSSRRAGWSSGFPAGAVEPCRGEGREVLAELLDHLDR